MDFGYTALNGIFPANEEEITKERKYPLTLHFCEECALVQVLEVIPPDHLYRSDAGYFYYSSAIESSVRHFATLAEDLRQFYAETGRDPGGIRLLEMGCNDGILLRPLRERGFGTLVGCDPATNCTAVATADGFQVYDEYFGGAAAELISRDHGAGSFDCIVTCNSFAHVDDMWDIMDGVQRLLRADGILVVEVHYLLALLRTMQFDGIYHEHMTHYSLTSMANFARLAGMDVFDARELPVHGGSVRFYMQRAGAGRPKSESFLRLVKAEEEAGIGLLQTYAGFSARIQAWAEAMQGLIRQLRGGGRTIFGYGASARATTIINICKLDGRHLSVVIDDAPFKINKHMPNNHVKIVSSEVLYTKPGVQDQETPPDYLLILAWPYAESIMKKHHRYLEAGGCFIVPLPAISIIHWENGTERVETIYGNK